MDRWRVAAFVWRQLISYRFFQPLQPLGVDAAPALAADVAALDQGLPAEAMPSDAPLAAISNYESEVQTASVPASQLLARGCPRHGFFTSPMLKPSPIWMRRPPKAWSAADVRPTCWWPTKSRFPDQLTKPPPTAPGMPHPHRR